MTHVAYLFTTFPKSTETFLQREIRTLLERSEIRITLYSLWGGESEFEGNPVHRWSRWRLLHLLWRLPHRLLTQPKALWSEVRVAFSQRPTSWLNTLENFIGWGWAMVEADRLGKIGATKIHAAWGSMPAAAASLTSRITGLPWSFEAHAYDLFEYGGDWLAKTKVGDAQRIRTSTEMGRRRLIECGAPEHKVTLIRRGLDLDRLPAVPNRLRHKVSEKSLRIVSVGRLVEKKGWELQPAIIAELMGRGWHIEAHFIGEGPLRDPLEAHIRDLDLTAAVTLTGHLPIEQVWQELQWADLFLYTGKTARSGDRDGFPNVIAEAMAMGLPIATSPAGAIAEVVQDRIHGALMPNREAEAWARRIDELFSSTDVIHGVGEACIHTACETFDISRNAARLEEFHQSKSPNRIEKRRDPRQESR